MKGEHVCQCKSYDEHCELTRPSTEELAEHQRVMRDAMTEEEREYGEYLERTNSEG